MWCAPPSCTTDPSLDPSQGTKFSEAPLEPRWRKLTKVGVLRHWQMKGPKLRKPTPAYQIPLTDTCVQSSARVIQSTCGLTQI